MGLETNLGSYVKMGGSFFRNLTTGETGASIGVKALGGVEIGTKNPKGIPITNPSPVTYTFSLGPFQRNTTLNETSVNYSISFVFGVGGEVSFNPKTFKRLASGCDRFTD